LFGHFCPFAHFFAFVAAHTLSLAVGTGTNPRHCLANLVFDILLGHLFGYFGAASSLLVALISCDCLLNGFGSDRLLNLPAFAFLAFIGRRAVAAATLLVTAATLLVAAALWTLAGGTVLIAATLLIAPVALIASAAIAAALITAVITTVAG